MRDLVVLFVRLVFTIARLSRPGGLRPAVAESILIKHQLQILNRWRKRSPNLRSSDRIIVSFCALLIRRARLILSAVTLKPSRLGATRCTHLNEGGDLASLFSSCLIEGGGTLFAIFLISSIIGAERIISECVSNCRLSGNTKLETLT